MGTGESRVAVPGGELVVVDHGGSGPDVLLVHSMAHSLPVWDGVAARLTQDARVVSFDLRGHGRSSAEATDIDQIPDDIVAVIDALGLDRPVLVGHDVSGGFTAAVAATHPEKIGALVLLDSPTVEPQAAVRETVAMVGTDEVRALIADRFGLGHTGPDAASADAFVEEYARRSSTDLLGAAAEAEATRVLMRRGIRSDADGSWIFRPTTDTLRALTHDPGTPTAHPGRELLADLEMPVGIVVLTRGRHGSGGEAMSDLVQSRPTMRMVTIDSDPQVQYTDPDAVAAAILETVRAADRPGQAA